MLAAAATTNKVKCIGFAALMSIMGAGKLTSAWASDDLSPSSLQRLATEPGVETQHLMDGDVAITRWRKNGVFVEQRRAGSQVTYWGDDESGKGAVICSWALDVQIRGVLEACPSEPFTELKQDLDEGIARIDAFIVANSIEPTSIDSLHAREDQAYVKMRDLARTDPVKGVKAYRSGDGGQLVALMANASREKRKQAFDDWLSVPRWPVLNPCL